MDYPSWLAYNQQALAVRLESLKQRWSRGAVDVAEETDEIETVPPPEVVATDSGQDSEDIAVGVGDEDHYPDAIDILQHRFGLSPFETEVLFLCCAVEFDLEIAEWCGVAKGNQDCHPTPALCFEWFADPAWDLMSPQRPLKKFMLIDFVADPGRPQLQSRMIADPRVVSFVRGLNDPDERLRWVLSPEDAEPIGRLSASQTAPLESYLAQSNSESDTDAMVQIVGASASIRKAAAWHLAEAHGTHLRTLCCDALPSALEELDLLSRLWNRERRLSPVSLMVEWSCDCDRSQCQRIENFVRRLEGRTMVSTSEPLPRLAATKIEVGYPTPDEQARCWLENLSIEGAEAIAGRLAAQFDLEIGEIDRIAHRVQGEGIAHERVSAAAWDACCAVARPALENLAQRVECKATWSDFVLLEESLGMLRQVVNQVRYRNLVLDQWGFRNKHNRGFGVTALFCGESGTGKTMAAEVIANDLELDLFRIDLSGVVNKYIGETEKNLRKVFDAAERGGAILFFDEADALFGKRSEVKDSHDRYANIEINYLLQRLESFRGLVILATNNKSHLDSAFTRRLRFIIDFPYPELAERRELWRHVLPDGTPHRGLDASTLAKLHLAGGNIHNIALNAAFAAAAEGDVVEMRHLLESARYELIKSQKPLSVPGITWPERQEMHS